MEIQVKVDDLKRSTANVRAGHTKEDIANMANSIKHRGILQPPLVAKNGDGRYEIVAGQLRVAGAIAAGVEAIGCIDVTALTEQERVAISLSENLDRRGMSAIETYKAFDKLFREGVSVEKIADQFNMTEKEAHQVLAIGGLPQKILDLAEKGEIGDRGLKELAIAPKAMQYKYAKLSAKERPKDWQIREWLAGNDGWYRADAALFDLKEYDGGRVTDLFNDDEVWLTDGTQFQELQKLALAAEIAKLTDLGWSVEQVDYWQEYAYDKTAKAKGGMVFYTISQRTGAVEFHKGYKRKGKAGKAPEAKNKDAVKEERPEISKAFETWMEEERNAAVSRYLIDCPKEGLPAIILLLMTQSDNIGFQSNTGSYRIKSEDQAKAHVHGDNYMHAWECYEGMLDELGIKEGTPIREINKSTVLTKLKEKPPRVLLQYLGIIMAVNWNIGWSADTTDQIGRGLGLKQVPVWEHTPAFWNSINNKQTLLDIGKECGIKLDTKAKAMDLRKVLAEQVPDDWRPKWLKF